MTLVYMLHLFNYYVGVFTVSDLFLILLVIYVIFKFKKIVLKKSYLPLILFWIITGVFSLFNLGSDFFSFNDFILAYLKLTLYVFSFVVLLPYFVKNYDKLNKIIINSLIILCGIGIYQLIAHYLFPYLPYSFAPEIFSNRPGYDAMFSYKSGGVFFRIKSIYSEPAHFSIYINLLYAYLLHNEIILKKWIHILIITTILLTLSLAGIGLLILNYSLVLIKYKVIKSKKAIFFISVFLGVLAFVASNEYVIRRVSNIISLTEGSGTRRLFGGFELAKEFPFYGIGLGNLQNFYYSLSKTFEYATGWQIHNVFPIIFSVSGIIGVCVFLYFLYQLNRNNYLLGIFLLGSFFTWGYFNTTPFWVFLLLIYTGNMSRSLMLR